MMGPGRILVSIHWKIFSRETGKSSYNHSVFKYILFDQCIKTFSPHLNTFGPGKSLRTYPILSLATMSSHDKVAIS